MAESKSRVKLVAATLGGGALVTMGALALSMNGGQPAVSPAIASSGMQTGVTVTSTTPGLAPATSIAVPPVKATFYGKS